MLRSCARVGALVYDSEARWTRRTRWTLHRVDTLDTSHQSDDTCFGPDGLWAGGIGLQFRPRTVQLVQLSCAAAWIWVQKGVCVEDDEWSGEMRREVPVVKMSENSGFRVILEEGTGVVRL